MQGVSTLARRMACGLATLCVRSRRVLARKDVADRPDDGCVVGRARQIEQLGQRLHGLEQRAMNTAIHACLAAALPNEVLGDESVAARRPTEHHPRQNRGAGRPVGEERQNAVERTGKFRRRVAARRRSATPWRRSSASVGGVHGVALTGACFDLRSSSSSSSFLLSSWWLS